jgi:hypothetical protein
VIATGTPIAPAIAIVQRLQAKHSISDCCLSTHVVIVSRALEANMVFGANLLFSANNLFVSASPSE